VSVKVVNQMAHTDVWPIETEWHIHVQVYGPQKLIGVNDKETALLRVDCRVD